MRTVAASGEAVREVALNLYRWCRSDTRLHPHPDCEWAWSRRALDGLAKCGEPCGHWHARGEDRETRLRGPILQRWHA